MVLLYWEVFGFVCNKFIDKVLARNLVVRTTRNKFFFSNYYTVTVLLKSLFIEIKRMYMKKLILLFVTVFACLHLIAQKKGFLQVQTISAASTSNEKDFLTSDGNWNYSGTTKGYGTGFQLATQYMYPLTKRIYAVGGFELLQSLNNKIGYKPNVGTISSQARSVQATAGINIYLSSEKKKCRFFWQTQVHVPLVATIRHYQEIIPFTGVIFPTPGPFVKTVYREKVMLKNNPGLSAQFGAEWKINKKLQLHAGLQYRHQALKLNRSEITSYRVNGVETVDQITTNLRKTIYLDEPLPNVGYDPNAPKIQLRQDVNFKSIGILAGVRVRL
jgi:hypothetical protein